MKCCASQRGRTYCPETQLSVCSQKVGRFPGTYSMAGEGRANTRSVTVRVCIPIDLDLTHGDEMATTKSAMPINEVHDLGLLLVVAHGVNS
jgi:hypothetical protein